MKHSNKSKILLAVVFISSMFFVVSCSDDETDNGRVTVNKIFWYSYEDQVPEGSTNPFNPTTEFESAFDVTHQSDEQLLDVPTGYDVLVMSDNYNSQFNLAEFTGSVIVTFDSGIEGMMRDFFNGESENVFQKKTYWDYTTNSTLNWITPQLDEEDCTEGNALVYADSLVNDFSWLERRNDLLQAESFSVDDSEADKNSDAVIIYEFKSGSQSTIRYWIHIGPVDVSFEERASEILKMALEKISK